MDKLLVKILPQKYPQSFTGKTCSPLLCYRFVSTTLAAQIPSGNAIANSQGLLHAETGFSYFGARYYDSDILTGWLSVDPLSDKYPNISPYSYCAWNPIKLVDPDGEDWYEKTIENGNGNTTIEYCESKKDCPSDGRYLGQAYIIFDGSRDEHPDEKGSIDGVNSKSAKVTVYGPNGSNDIHIFNGYTMTSNPEKYIPIAEGEYQGYSNGNKKGSLPSIWYIADNNAIKNAQFNKKIKGWTSACFTMDGLSNTNPQCEGDWNYNTIYKTGIYIHSTGRNGRLGTCNSTGCLLISDQDWNKFKDVMKGVKNYKVQVTR